MRSAIGRRDVLRLSAMAASAFALPARADTSAPKPMRLLILGGTGFIGPYQVRYALARGHHVTIFNRGRQQEAWPGPVEELLGDRNGDLKALAGRDWDVCIDNPTTLPAWVRGAAGVLKGHVERYIFISTISAYAANDKAADETAALATYNGVDAMAETTELLNANPRLYGPLKAASETEARAQFGDAATTIVRPSLIVGPGDGTDRFTYWPVRLARGGDVLAPGDGSDPVQFIDARDLAEWTVRLAERRTAGVFNASGPAEPMTMRQMLEGIAQGIHVDPKITWDLPISCGRTRSRPGATCRCGYPARATPSAFIAATSTAPSPRASPIVRCR